MYKSKVLGPLENFERRLYNEYSLSFFFSGGQGIGCIEAGVDDPIEKLLGIGFKKNEQKTLERRYGAKSAAKVGTKKTDIRKRKTADLVAV